MAQWERKHLPMQETRIQSLGQDDPLEKEMATHSSIPVWNIPWTEESGRLQSMASQSNTVGRLSMHVETREEQSRNNKASLGNLPGSPSRDIPNNILELICRY